VRALRILIAGAAISLGILGIRWAWNEAGLLEAGPGKEPAGATARGADSPPVDEQGRAPRHFVEFGDRIPDVVLIDQDGRSFRTSDLRGSPLVLSLIYTHCNLPSMCPMTTARLARVRDLVSEEGSSDVRFVLVSFDTERDRPERLKEYAERYKMNLPDVTFATGSPDEIERLSSSLKTYYRKNTNEVFDHNIVVSVVDRDGVLRDEFYGTSWTVDELAAAVHRVHGDREAGAGAHDSPLNGRGGASRRSPRGELEGTHKNNSPRAAGFGQGRVSATRLSASGRSASVWRSPGTGPPRSDCPRSAGAPPR
jgi:protein SCO1/2